MVPERDGQAETNVQNVSTSDPTLHTRAVRSHRLWHILRAGPIFNRLNDPVVDDPVVYDPDRRSPPLIRTGIQ